MLSVPMILLMLFAAIINQRILTCSTLEFAQMSTNDAIWNLFIRFKSEQFVFAQLCSQSILIHYLFIIIISKVFIENILCWQLRSEHLQCTLFAAAFVLSTNENVNNSVIAPIKLINGCIKLQQKLQWFVTSSALQFFGSWNVPWIQPWGLAANFGW